MLDVDDDIDEDCDFVSDADPVDEDIVSPTELLEAGRFEGAELLSDAALLESSGSLFSFTTVVPKLDPPFEPGANEEPSEKTLTAALAIGSVIPESLRMFLWLFESPFTEISSIDKITES